MDTEATLQDKQIVLFQVIGIFIIPILLLYYNIFSKGLRVIILGIACICIGIIIHREKWTFPSLGLSTHTFKKYLIPYLLFICVGVTGILLFAENYEMEPQSDWWTKPHFLFLFLVVSFLQEFAYRGFLIPKLKKVFSDRLGVVLINALIFTLLHIIYPIPQLMLPLAFAGGLAFATIYMKYPNLVLISIAHSVLNFVAVLYGFFVIHS